MLIGGPHLELEAAIATAVIKMGVEIPPETELVRTKNPAHGDYASSVAMKLTRELGASPAAIAQRLAGLMELPQASVAVVGAYLNLTLRPDWLRQLVAHVAASQDWGASELGARQRVQVEFASVNPTGPLHIGHGRGVILGDTLCRLLAFTGHQVEREYYVNDQNTQARLFGASIFARMHEQDVPEGGYQADYVRELAEQAALGQPGLGEMAEEEAKSELRRFGVQRMVERLRESVARIGVTYDSWLFESSLWDEGLAQAAIERLRAGGHLKEKEGALWFSPEVPGWKDLDEDRVVVRSNGEPTYFASDLGYLLSKFERRGFERGIVVWGADHHGYVPRIRAAMVAMGLKPERLVVILNQLVNLKDGKMSKRQGRFVLLDDLVDRVGADVVRYFFLMRSPEAMMEFDLDLATSEGNDNPVFYAQYAHARLAGVERTALDRHPHLPESAPLGLLEQPSELALARQIAFWPDVVRVAAQELQPHRLPYYVHDLSEAVHAFYHSGNQNPELRVVVDDPELTRARLELCRAAQKTLRNALSLMGVSAPERM